MFEANLKKSDLIEFAKTMQASFDILRKEIKKEPEKPKSEQDDGFVLIFHSGYFGEKNFETEKAFTEELKVLMLKYGIFTVSADLRKRF